MPSLLSSALFEPITNAIAAGRQIVLILGHWNLLGNQKVAFQTLHSSGIVTVTTILIVVPHWPPWAPRGQTLQEGGYIQVTESKLQEVVSGSRAGDVFNVGSDDIATKIEEITASPESPLIIAIDSYKASDEAGGILALVREGGVTIALDVDVSVERVEHLDAKRDDEEMRGYDANIAMNPSKLVDFITAMAAAKPQSAPAA